MKGSAITGPVGKEAAELWPVSRVVIALVSDTANRLSAYCLQLRCCDVRCCFGEGWFMHAFWRAGVHS